MVCEWKSLEVSDVPHQSGGEGTHGVSIPPAYFGAETNRWLAGDYRGERGSERRRDVYFSFHFLDSLFQICATCKLRYTHCMHPDGKALAFELNIKRESFHRDVKFAKNGSRKLHVNIQTNTSQLKRTGGMCWCGVVPNGISYSCQLTRSLEKRENTALILPYSPVSPQLSNEPRAAATQ